MPRIKYPQGSDLAVTVKEAGRLLGVSEHTIWRMIESGQLRSVRLGDRLRRIPRTAIMEVLEGEQPNS